MRCGLGLGLLDCTSGAVSIIGARVLATVLCLLDLKDQLYSSFLPDLERADCCRILLLRISSL